MPEMHRQGKLILFNDHYTELVEGSTISEEVLWGRGYQSIGRPTSSDDSPRKQLTQAGIPTWATAENRYFPGLLIPLYRPTGERVSWIYKPKTAVANRDGKKMKYASAKGRTSVIDVHPINRDRIVDPTIDLWLTEGVKKADALTSRGLCVAALSGVYNWRSNMGSLGEWEDIPLRNRNVVICFDSDAKTKPDVMRAMIRLGNWLKSKGAKPHYLITPDAWANVPTKGADDYLAAGGTVGQLLDQAVTAAPRMDGDTSDTFTDARLAETIADEVFDGGYCWAGALGWMQWTKTGVWRDCTEVTVGEAVRRYSLNRFTAAVLDKDRNPTVIDGWRTMLSAGRERSVAGMAKGLVEKRGDAFDVHPDLLNTPSGVVDLATSEILPHDPDLLMRKQTGVGYDPDARHEDWDKALTCIPDDIRDYLQIRLGQAITGHTPPDDVLLILQGGGENGKSTLSATIKEALGKYYVLVSDRTLMASHDAHPTELMDFQGARYAVLEETPEARKLDVQRLKKSVGTPTITARHIRKDSVQFDATHTLIINTNHKPIVNETDHGTWRRLMLIEFPYRYRKDHEPLEGPNDRHGDQGLRDRCKTNPEVHAAALAWLIDGARKWYEGGKVMPAPPSRATRDTRAWRGESDQVLAYIGDRLILDEDSHVLSTELLADFNQWLKDKGNVPWSDHTFVTRFGSHDELGGKLTKKKIRARSGLSRSPQSAWDGGAFRHEPGATYNAWLGVRFGTPELPDVEEVTPIYRNSVTSGNEDHVPAVPGRRDDTADDPLVRVNPEGRNGWNMILKGSNVPDVPEKHEQLELPRGWRDTRNTEPCERCHMPTGSQVHRIRCGSEESDSQ